MNPCTRLGHFAKECREENDSCYRNQIYEQKFKTIRFSARLIISCQGIWL